MSIIQHHLTLKFTSLTSLIAIIIRKKRVLIHHKPEHSIRIGATYIADKHRPTKSLNSLENLQLYNQGDTQLTLDPMSIVMIITNLSY